MGLKRWKKTKKVKRPDTQKEGYIHPEKYEPELNREGIFQSTRYAEEEFGFKAIPEYMMADQNGLLRWEGPAERIARFESCHGDLVRKYFGSSYKLYSTAPEDIFRLLGALTIPENKTFATNLDREAIKLVGTELPDLKVEVADVPIKVFKFIVEEESDGLGRDRFNIQPRELPIVVSGAGLKGPMLMISMRTEFADMSNRKSIVFVTSDDESLEGVLKLFTELRVIARKAQRVARCIDVYSEEPIPLPPSSWSTWDNVFLSDDVIKRVKDDLFFFINNRKVFDDAGIPYKRGFLLCGPPGCGKCLGIDTPILMADRTVKKVQDVAVNDLLMGPDGLSRQVSSLARGREEMFRITPQKGDPYVANRSHILSLKCTRRFDRYIVGEVVNISIDKYLKETPDFKHHMKGWRIDPQKKDVLVTGIKVESIGVGDYYGFELEGADRLFLLGDFTVTHNTSVCRTIATSMDFACFMFDFSNDQLHNASLTDAFKIATAAAPSIFFLEDIDRVYDRESKDASNVTLDHLLNCLDGMVVNDGLVVIATANNPDKLDPAIRARPGRFDQVVTIGLPDAKLRRRYLAHLFRKVGVADVDLDYMVDETEGLSMAFLKEIFVVTATKATMAQSAITTEAVKESVEQVMAQYGGTKTKRAGFGK